MLDFHNPDNALIVELIDARYDAELTQQELADRMKTSRTSVGRVESGKMNPSFNWILRYAHALGYTIVLKGVLEQADER